MARKGWAWGYGLLMLVGMVLLITNTSEAAQAVQEGIALCMQTVIPALFPFLVLNRLLLRADWVGSLAMKLGPWMERLFHLPSSAAPALMTGFLGGYPTGASSVAALYADGELSSEDAEQLLAFCNNAGPAFIFGMVGGLFGSRRTAMVLLGIHILSALLCGCILQAGKRQRPSVSIKRIRLNRTAFRLEDSLRTMALICACIVLFRIPVRFLTRLPVLQRVPALGVGAAGLLELAGGCCLLPGVEAAGLRYCLASGFLGFGGLCVYMQTVAILRSAGLKGKYYLFGKILQASIAVLLTWAVMVLAPGLLPREIHTAYLPNHAGLVRSTASVAGLCLVLCGIWCIYLRKRSGNVQADVV